MKLEMPILRLVVNGIISLHDARTIYSYQDIMKMNDAFDFFEYHKNDVKK